MSSGGVSVLFINLCKYPKAYKDGDEIVTNNDSIAETTNGESKMSSNSFIIEEEQGLSHEEVFKATHADWEVGSIVVFDVDPEKNQYVIVKRVEKGDLYLFMLNLNDKYYEFTVEENKSIVREYLESAKAPPMAPENMKTLGLAGGVGNIEVIPEKVKAGIFYRKSDVYTNIIMETGKHLKGLFAYRKELFDFYKSYKKFMPTSVLVAHKSFEFSVSYNDGFDKLKIDINDSNICNSEGVSKKEVEEIKAEYEGKIAGNKAIYEKEKEESLNRLREEYEKKIADNENKYKDEIRKRDEKINELEKGLEESEVNLRKIENEYKKKITDNESEIKESKIRICGIEKLLEENEAKLREMEENEKRYKERIERLEITNKNCNDNVEKYDEKICELEEKLKESEAKLREMEGNEETYKVNIESYEVMIRNCNENVKKHEEKICELEEKLKESEAKLGEMVKNEGIYKENIRNLKSEIYVMNELAEASKKEDEEKFNEAVGKIKAEYEEKIAGNNAKSEEEKEKVLNELKEGYEKKIADNENRHRMEIEECKKVNEDLSKNIREKSELITSLDTANRKLTSEAEENQKKIQSLNLAYGNIISQANDMHTKYTKSIQEYSKMEATLKPENSMLKTENNTLRAENNALQAEYNNLRAENNALKTEYSNLKAINDALRAECDRSKTNLELLTGEINLIKPQAMESVRLEQENESLSRMNAEFVASLSEKDDVINKLIVLIDYYDGYSMYMANKYLQKS